ncbi:MAG TPA: hypothetical protein GYA07_13275 [Verrucomicrobia bacterium]|nr:hypothetical protein [Verrucomicrobiota bacterium]HOB31569.1 hypothetical protein [Verrucomicrobiota bacterium]HOP98773.1 hypothetical protein [Verrucomicrobiota bacterium]HPU56028.1 hypothetical protein [Verrucomicrobiota bacterium]
MTQNLSTVKTSVECGILRKGSRVFALLGKPTASGISSFRRDDVGRSWAVTAEMGCLRLERLEGDEEVTGLQIFLTTPFSYEYGIAGVDNAPELTRAIFGLLPSELDLLVSTLRRGSFPVLGFAPGNLKCAVSSSIIPAGWPHVVVSNLSLYGNIVSLESFVRIVVASLPNGQLTTRYPDLQPVIKQMLRLMVVHRRGLPYSREVVDLALAPASRGA